MRCVFPYFKNDSFHIQIQYVVVFATKQLETVLLKLNGLKSQNISVCLKYRANLKLHHVMLLTSVIQWNQPVSSLLKKLLEESVATTDFIKVIVISTYQLLLVITDKASKSSYRCRVYSFLWFSLWRIQFWCIMGAPQHPSHHDSLHSFPFYLKGPWTAAKLVNPPKQVVVRNIMINPKINLGLTRGW